MIAGSIDFGMPMMPRISSSQSRVSRSISIVRLALVTSVTWTPPLVPPVRFQMHQVSMLPNSRSPASALRARAVDVVQDPLDLGAREVGRQRQADLGPEAVLAAVLAELVDVDVGARVLPDDRVVDGLAGVLVPDDRGLALVGDADGGDVGGGDAGLLEGALDDLLAARPDLRRIVLDPARLGVDLLVLLLVDRDDAAGVVEDHEAGARGALVEGSDVLRHAVTPIVCAVSPPRPGTRRRQRP